MRRVSIRILMIAVLMSAVGLAALRDAGDPWEQVILLVALAAFGVTGMAALILRRKERYWWAGHACCALWMYIVSLVFPDLHLDGRHLPVLGLLAFGEALKTLVRCIMSPASALAGDWLVGLAWLANPAAWAGMVFLLVGRARRAALSGEVALLLAACACVPFMFCQYIWVASMVYLVYAALRAPDDASGADNAILAEPPLPKLRPIFYPAVALPVLFGLLLLLSVQQGLIKSTPLLPESDPNDNVHTREDARLRILDLAQRTAWPGVDKPEMPPSASNFWLYEDGSFSGWGAYWMFHCGSREECLKAVEGLTGLRRNDLSP